MGVLSALPLVNLGNLCCRFWVVSGGLVAAYLLQQGRPDAITPSEGAIVGLLAGIVGAFVQFLVSIPIGLIVAPLERGLMQRAADMAGGSVPDRNCGHRRLVASRVENRRGHGVGPIQSSAGSYRWLAADRGNIANNITSNPSSFEALSVS